MRRYVIAPGCWTLLVAGLLLVGAGHRARAEVNWPGWGGPTGTSHTAEKGLPLSWTADDVLWKSPL